VLLHSLSHSLMAEIALDCGYPASSLKERVYALSGPDGAPERCGILIYTATAGAQGTLGGLVGTAPRFAAVRDGPSAEQNYLRLLDACEALAVAAGMPNLLAGANMARHEAYRHLVERGFRTEIQGVAMHKGNDPGYCRAGAYIIDDWR
jgi:hypothetical protein